MPRVIIIDHDPNMRELLRMHLSRAGVAAEVARDAAAGIRLIVARPPDVLVLDLMLPDLGGLEILEAARGDPVTKDLPVVVITSRQDEDTYIEAKRLGANVFLNKPFTSEQLVDAVLGQIAQRKAKDLSASAG